MNGDLAKAPRFDSVQEFDKDSHKLYKAHTHIDKLGFVWVNLDAAETPTHSWEEQFGGVTEQPRLANYDLNNYKFDHTWSMEGKFNWKTLIENYNEVGDKSCDIQTSSLLMLLKSVTIVPLLIQVSHPFSRATGRWYMAARNTGLSTLVAKERRDQALSVLHLRSQMLPSL
jgi:hypothetical protein